MSECEGIICPADECDQIFTTLYAVPGGLARHLGAGLRGEDDPHRQIHLNLELMEPPLPTMDGASSDESELMLGPDDDSDDSPVPSGRYMMHGMRAKERVAEDADDDNDDAPIPSGRYMMHGIMVKERVAEDGNKDRVAGGVKITDVGMTDAWNRSSDEEMLDLELSEGGENRDVQLRRMFDLH